MKTTRILCLFLALLLLSGCGGTAAANEKDAAETTAAYILETVKEPGYGNIAGEWVVLGMARGGFEVPDGYFEGYYERLCEAVLEADGVLDKRKYTEYSRVILALTAIGKDPTDVAGYNLLAPLADFEQTCFQGVNGAVYALLALDCGSYDSTLRDAYLEEILSKEAPGGGWSFAGGSTGETDFTAMALQALAKYRDRADVDAAVERALALLSNTQREDGGFGEADSCETLAQVIVALTELGISINDERFVKNGNTVETRMMAYATQDGGFGHLLGGETADLLATEQAFYALTALKRAADGESSLFRMK